jgi:hypothetical protein
MSTEEIKRSRDTASIVESGEETEINPPQNGDRSSMKRKIINPDNEYLDDTLFASNEREKYNKTILRRIIKDVTMFHSTGKCCLMEQDHGRDLFILLKSCRNIVYGINRKSCFGCVRVSEEMQMSLHSCIKVLKQ